MLLFGFSLSDFISWLIVHADDDEVGLANHCNLCPIATFIAQRMEAKVEVRADVVILTFNDGTEITTDTPQWAWTFISRVDEGCWLSQPPVSAVIALEIAEEIQVQEAA